jgi:hypothetical protein
MLLPTLVIETAKDIGRIGGTGFQPVESWVIILLTRFMYMTR